MLVIEDNYTVNKVVIRTDWRVFVLGLLLAFEGVIWLWEPHYLILEAFEAFGGNAAFFKLDVEVVVLFDVCF